MSIAIRIEGLSKCYRLGSRLQSADTLVGAVTNFVKAPLREFQRLRGLTAIPSDESDQHDVLWALRNVSFEVERGEVLGIIGRNGAGKSTLLKILSHVTEPSRGRIEMFGHVASLLEVGTGFHAELTGRENIYLNGTILGMTRAEIHRKFDAIVEFSGVERFIDTPVKHYSSGMQVRLAFSVAAHLEPEVLIIDEVLAVGDAAFQKKCLGKMQDVAGEGRTILFVSHDLAAVENLCSRALLLDAGRCIADGAARETIAQYQRTILEIASADLTDRPDRRGDGAVKFTRVQLLDENGCEPGVFLSGKPLRIRLHYRALGPTSLPNARVSVSVHSSGRVYFIGSTELLCDAPLTLPPVGSVDCIFDELPLSLGTYYLNPFLEVNGIVQDWIEGATAFRVEDGNFYGTGRDYPRGWEGKTVLVKHRWSVGTV